MTLGERAIVTAILCGMVLVIAFLVVGVLFPELRAWYGRSPKGGSDEGEASWKLS